MSYADLMRRLGGAFIDEVAEAEYQRITVAENLPVVRIACLLAMFLVTYFGLVDYLLYEVPADYLLSFRGYWMIVISMFLLSTYTSWYVNHSQLAGMSVIGFFCFGWIIARDTSFYQFVQVQVFNYYFCGLLFRFAIISGLIPMAYLLYFVALWDVPISDRMSEVGTLVTMNILLGLAAFQKESISRKLFLNERREREFIIKQREADQKYLGWLRNLAKFLRHEVRQPISQIQSSLELLKLMAPGNENFQSQLESTAASTHRVWELLERASRATDAETFVREGDRDLISLSKTVAESVRLFEQTIDENNVRLLLPSENLLVSANSNLVHEAVTNLLANAYSFSEEGTEVVITVAASDTTAKITVRNFGPPLAAEVEELFGAFNSTRAATSSEHQGIGLYLVRLIAQHHGGDATVRNLPDGSGVEAAFWLPRVLHEGEQQSALSRNL